MQRRSWPICIVIVLWTAASSGVVLRGQQEHEGQYAQSDVIKGQGLYEQHCSMCHGTNGNSVGGVDLRRGQFRNARSDEDLSRVVGTGIPGTAMPAFNLEAAELRAIVGFIRAGFELNASAMKIGDVARGKAIFDGKGNCRSCHRVSGVGPRSAPDLTDIGSARRPSFIYGALTNPAGYLMPMNRRVRAVTKEDKVIVGRRLNEDTYTVQLIDEKEQLISLIKADLQEYQVIKTPQMPTYADKLTADERADLLAYLVSLKG